MNYYVYLIISGTKHNIHCPASKPVYQHSILCRKKSYTSDIIGTKSISSKAAEKYNTVNTDQYYFSQNDYREIGQQ